MESFEEPQAPRPRQAKASPAKATPAEASNPLSSPYLGAALRLTAAAFIAFNLGKHGIYRPLTIHGVDYPKHWEAARAILEGRNNYIGGDLWLGFNYPQWSALATAWLGWFDVDTAQWIWKLMMLASLVGAWWIGWRSFRPDLSPESGAPGPRSAAHGFIADGLQRHWILTSAFIVVMFSPAGAVTLFVGNIDPFNAFLVMAFFGSVLGGRDRLGGVYWAMLCLVKMVPVVLIVPIVLWRRWRLLQGWLAFMAGYFVVLVVTGRLQYEWFFVHEMMGEISFYWRGLSQSIPRLCLLLFMPDRWHDDPVIYNRVINIGLAMIGVIYVAVIAGMRRRGWSFMRTLEIATLFVPLLSPLLESHHLAWILPIFFLHVARWMRGETPAALSALLAVGWTVVCMVYFGYNILARFEWAYFISIMGLMIVMTGAMVELGRGETPAVNRESAANI